MHVDGADMVLHGVGGYCASTRSSSILKHVMAYCLGVNVRSRAATCFPNDSASSVCLGFLISSSRSIRLLSTGSISQEARFLLTCLFFMMCVPLAHYKRKKEYHNIHKFSHLSSVSPSPTSLNVSSATIFLVEDNLHITSSDGCHL